MSYRIVSASEPAERQFSIFVVDDSGDTIDDAYLAASGPTSSDDVNDYFADVFGVRPVDDRGKVIVLDGFEIPSELRGQRIGSRMMNAFVAEARESRAKAVFLVADNRRVERLYERFGFVPVDLTAIGTVMKLSLGR